MKRCKHDVADGDCFKCYPTVLPIEEWVEKNHKVKSLLDDFVCHAENSVCGNMAPVEMAEQTEEFKRMCAISLRQFLEK